MQKLLSNISAGLSAAWSNSHSALYFVAIRLANLLKRLLARIIRARLQLNHTIRKHFSNALIPFLAGLSCLLILMSIVFVDEVTTWFEKSGLVNRAALDSFCFGLGGALVSASAIAFSLVMFAMQVNIERMPFGVFSRLTSDWRLMSTFASSMLIAVALTTLGVFTQNVALGWIVVSIFWSIVGTIVLFILAYDRALKLINPSFQLRMVARAASAPMERSVRLAHQLAPLVKNSDQQGDSTHDMERLQFFLLNPGWTQPALQSLRHANTYSRRYSAIGDYEVSELALETMVQINRAYVAAKGKTFFASNGPIDHPLQTDGLVNRTLELLRENARLATVTGDEVQIELNLKAFAALATTYLQINYAYPYTPKHHANLAAGYLANAVEAVLPGKYADVAMQGLRLLGACAVRFINQSNSTSVSLVSERITTIAYVGLAVPDLEPIVPTAVDQLSTCVYASLIATDGARSNTADELHGEINRIAEFQVSLPDTPLVSKHQSHIAPYYSSTSLESFPAKLVQLANFLINSDADNAVSQTVIGNIAEWSSELHSPQKKLFLAALAKQSGLTFDVFHWIAKVAEITLALSKCNACPERCVDDLQKNATSLIYVFSWVPDDPAQTKYLDTFSFTETLAELAFDTIQHQEAEAVEAAFSILVGWGIKAATHDKHSDALLNALRACAGAIACADDFTAHAVTTTLRSKLPNAAPLGDEVLEVLGQKLTTEAERPDYNRLSMSRIGAVLQASDSTKRAAALTGIAELLLDLRK